jgi:putative membrane protein
MADDFEQQGRPPAPGQGQDAQGQGQGQDASGRAGQQQPDAQGQFGQHQQQYPAHQPFGQQPGPQYGQTPGRPPFQQAPNQAPPVPGAQQAPNPASPPAAPNQPSPQAAPAAQPMSRREARQAAQREAAGQQVHGQQPSQQVPPAQPPAPSQQQSPVQQQVPNQQPPQGFGQQQAPGQPQHGQPASSQQRPAQSHSANAQQQPPQGYPQQQGQAAQGRSQQQQSGRQQGQPAQSFPPQPGQQQPGPQQGFAQYPGQPQQGQPQPQQGYPPQTQQGYPQHPQQQFPPQAPGGVGDLADGNWHRLHPATLWINIVGGIFAFFWVGIVLLMSFFPAVAEDGLPGFVILLALVGVFVVFVLAILGTWLGYRNTEFRLTDEVFELRKGVLNKSNRQVRFDRLQSVNLNRPVFARIFNLTDVETSGAGDKAGFSLKYLNADQANGLRAELLRRASGAKKRQNARRHQLAEQAAAPAGQYAGPAGPAAPGAPGIPGAPMQSGATPPPAPRRGQLSAFVDRAVEDFAGPELSPEMVAEQSVVRVKPARMAATSALGGVLAAAILIVVSIIGYIVVRGILGAALPTDVPFGFDVAWLLGSVGTIGFVLFITLVSAGSTALGNMQYTIAGTPDGLRVGRGILNQTNDTLPPGRIHSIEVRQPVLWKPFKWYSIRVNRADVQTGTSQQEQQNALQRFIVLPVGTRGEVERVLQLIMPMHMNPRTAQLLESGFKGGRNREFTPAPLRAWWLHPFSIRFIGGAIDGGVVYIRTGWLTRSIAMVPGERIQSVTARASLFERMTNVGNIRIDTVAGPIHPILPAVSADLINGLHEELSKLAIRAAKEDTSHRWFEAQARATVAAAHMHAADARRTGRALDPQTQRVLAAEEAWRREQQAASAGSPGSAPGAGQVPGAGQAPGAGHAPSAGQAPGAGQAPNPGSAPTQTPNAGPAPTQGRPPQPPAGPRP